MKLERAVSYSPSTSVSEASGDMRPAVPDDDAALIAIARRTGVFSAEELECLKEDLESYHAGLYGVGEEGDKIIVLAEGSQILGFAHYGKLVITDRSWMLHWIAVDQSAQFQGMGRRLMEVVETEIRARQARMMFIETASAPAYIPTRNFYLRQGYQVAARIEHYYAEGEHKFVFSKLLSV